MKKFTKEESIPLSTLSEKSIKSLNAETRIWYNCTKCNQLVIRRIAIYRKDRLTLCPACKMELHKGYRNAFLAPDFLEKRKKAFEEKYGSYEQGYKVCRAKTEKTNLEKYGCKAPLQNEAIKQKFLETNNERYGGNSPSCDKEVKDKQTSTTIKNWGCKSSAQSPLVKAKMKQTCLERYGVPSTYLLSNCIQKHSRYKYKYDEEVFDSSWELVLYVYAVEHKEPIKRNPCKINYTYKGEDHLYYPDFEYNGRLIEVKGGQFFKEGKMINPFDSSLNGLCEAKHQCMIENNVEIWGQKEIKFFKDWVEKTKGKDFIENCKCFKYKNCKA